LYGIGVDRRSELRFGLALRTDAINLHRLVGAFLDTAVTLGWDAGAADQHGTVRATLRQRGQSIGDFDEMIGAHALAVGAVVVTANDTHFSRLDGLAVQNWLRGWAASTAGGLGRADLSACGGHHGAVLIAVEPTCRH